MESNQPPDGADKEPEGPQPKKPKLQRATTLAAAAATTAVEGELTLVSSVDGGSVTVTVAAVAQSSTLDPDSGKLDFSEPVQVPSTSAAISKAVVWIQHEWHRNQAPLSEEAQAAFVSDFVAQLAKDCALYAAVFTVADFLGLDSLLSTLLSSLGVDGGIGLLRACIKSFPPLASRLAPKLGQHIDEKKTQALLEAVLACDDAATDEEKSAALDWVQLQLCDGKYLRRVNQLNPHFINLPAEEENELAAMPPKPMRKQTVEDVVNMFVDGGLSTDEAKTDEAQKQAHELLETTELPDVHDEASDPVAKRRNELEAKRDTRYMPGTHACLGLFAWAQAERERRQALTNAAAAANKVARATTSLLTAEQASAKDLAELTAEEAAMPPKPTKKAERSWMPDVYDEASDPVAARRKEVALRRALLIGLTPDEAKKLAELTAEDAELAAQEATMPLKPMKEGEHWCSDEVYDEASDPVAARRKEIEALRKEVVARRKQLIQKQFAALGALDEQLADAVKSGDLAAAKAAFEKGAALDVHYVGGMRSDRNIIDDRLSKKNGCDMSAINWVTPDALPDNLRGAGCDGYELYGYEPDNPPVAYPLICFAANDVTMVNWMLDNGADITLKQPEGIVSGDGFDYGGANVLVSATTVEAVELLCARGADVDCTWTPAHYEPQESERGLITSDGPIARCFARHGINVNAIYDPGQQNLKDAYWKTVVESDDVAWAAELLTKYGANVDWPSEHDLYFEYEEEHSGWCFDFSTVLMVAIRKQDLPMVRLLLEHGADVNKTKPNFADGDSDEEDEDETDNQDEKPSELPLSVALETGNEAIIELLKAKGAKVSDE